MKNIFLKHLKEYTTCKNLKLMKYLNTSLQEWYNTPVRCYHTWEHAVDCVKKLLSLPEEHKPKPETFKQILFALYYHDCVYRPGSKYNETNSAERAAVDLNTLGFSDLFASKVERYILLTSHQWRTSEYAGRLIMDIDLSILGSSKTKFNEYEKKIRLEHKKYDDETYTKGRVEILSSFIKKPHIYATPYFQNLYEDKARSNILRIIALLENS